MEGAFKKPPFPYIFSIYLTKVPMGEIPLEQKSPSTCNKREKKARK